MIEWTKSFSVGVDFLDAYHQEWFEAVNNFAETIARGSRKKQILKALQSMSDSCDMLFLEEERFLQKINYVETEEHAMHHKDFRDNYIGLLKKMLLDDNKLFISAAKYLDPWVINHVLVLDKKYGGFYLAMSK